MLEPNKDDPNYAAEESRRQQQIKEGNGTTDWGQTAEAVDMQKSPLATGQAGGGKKPKE
jgi:hypothetical protein